MEEAFNTSNEDAEATAKERNAARDSMLLQASLHRADSPGLKPITLRIRNLSAGGLMADCSEPLTSDEHVVLELRGIGETTGQVAWCRGGRVGISFDAPIDPRQARKPVAAPKHPSTPVVVARRPGLKIS